MGSETTSHGCMAAWLRECTKPLYEMDKDIIKCMQAAEPYHGQLTLESVQAKEEGRYV